MKNSKNERFKNDLKILQIFIEIIDKTSLLKRTKTKNKKIAQLIQFNQTVFFNFGRF